MKTKIIDAIDQIPAVEWNSLLEDSNPFLRHEFLAALERHDCVSKTCGWQPQHLAIYEDDKLVGASPLYIKYHSHGEFVFDWSWAEAYQRHRLDYYPKLVSAIPFTPLSGQRLLVAKHADKQTLCEQLINTTIELAKNSNFSSAHWLFPTKEETKLFTKQELTTRLGCQYHWHNNGYQSFEDYLKHLNARKRKNILKERRQIEKAGIKFRVLSGNEITQDEWNIFHHYYKTIYDRKWGYPSLTQAFFEEIGNTLPENIVLVLAYKQDECIAMALNLRSDHTLYGRHWGCSEYIPALHFETCYYQGLEYCIKHGLKSFEPGAQGEHKIARGFLPTATWSAHWIGHKGFADAIDEFCQREKNEMEYVIEHLTQQSPFRKKTY